MTARLALATALLLVLGCARGDSGAGIADGNSPGASPEESKQPAKPVLSIVEKSGRAPVDPNLGPVGAPTDFGVDPADSPEGISDLISKMNQAFNDRDWKAAFEYAEQAIEGDPDNGRLLLAASNAAQQHGMQSVQSGGDRKAANEYFLKSAALLRKLLDSDNAMQEAAKQLADHTIYNEACAYATNGELDKALASLKDAFAHGFHDFELVATDADFTELRKNPEFDKIVNEVRTSKVREQLASHQPFDFDFNLVSTADEKITLSDYQGKLVIVDFWGTWCPPCRAEIPHFLKLYENYKDRGLEIVGINYERGDPAESVAKIKDFAEEHGVTYPCLIGDDATQDQVPNFEGYPTTLFVDRAGKVRLKLVGYHAYEDLESIILALLEEPAEQS